MDKIVNNALAQLRPEFDKGNFDRVIELCGKVLTYHPDHGVAMFFRASSKLKKELYDEAETDFVAGLPLAESNEQLHVAYLRGLSTLYEATEEDEKLVGVLSKLLDHKLASTAYATLTDPVDRKKPVQKLFEDAEKVCKLLAEDNKFADAEAVMMKVITFPGELPAEQRQKAIIHLLTMHQFYKIKADRVELSKKGIELNPAWEGAEKLLEILHDSATERIKDALDSRKEIIVRHSWAAVLDAVRAVAGAAGSSPRLKDKAASCAAEFCLGLGSTMKEIEAGMGPVAKGNLQADLFAYVRDRVRTGQRVSGAAELWTRTSKAAFPAFFLFSDLLAVFWSISEHYRLTRRWRR